MNTSRWSLIAAMLGLCCVALSCQSPQPTVPAKPPTAPVAPALAEPESGNAFSGKIVRLRVSARLLTVKSAAGQKDFVVGPGAPVFTEASRRATLATLNVGDLVDVEYEQHDAVATATRIVRTAVAAGEKPAPEVERLERMLNPDPNNPFRTE
jgi:hypothetical protein